jgi:hypothetical protein
MREDEHHEVSLLEAKEYLKRELDMLEFNHKKALYLDRFHTAMDLEYLMWEKQQEIDNLNNKKND